MPHKRRKPFNVNTAGERELWIHARGLATQIECWWESNLTMEEVGWLAGELRLALAELDRRRPLTVFHS